MKRKTPGRVDARRRGEIGKPESPYLALLDENFNQPDAARRQRFLHLGRELHRRGEFPCAQFCAELADLPNADEILRCLEDFTRVSVGEYMAVNADKFPSYLISLDGGKK